ncbi:hypothetical protein FBD94_06970 [Pedobacter hiemivivus]|uniref:DUF4369 domain-containing protein n=1 Tax=Pedobacter hiemivivus TaxID=2530454 RepID=A0A4V5PE86_9SPHI|nr:hypothetical protein [Pedobacter hiemivivus]TKC64076.1 hypothetical protein FBD94_06970 [Pedobacter hiemivivus]
MMSVFACLLVIAAIILIAAKASLNLFLLTGTVSGKNGELVALISDEPTGNGQILCSVTIQNDCFRLSSEQVNDGPAYLVFGEGNDKTRYPVMLRKGHFSFCETEESIKNYIK